jgi:hypothetical protein
MPRCGSNGYVPPTAAQHADWRTAVDRMLQGACDFTAHDSLAGITQIRTFTDTSNGRDYCLLMEVQDQDGNGVVDRGFGAVIVYPDATRQLSRQAVHPIADSNTDAQAVTVFKDTDSRSPALHRRTYAARGSAPRKCRNSELRTNTIAVRVDRRFRPRP